VDAGCVPLLAELMQTAKRREATGFGNTLSKVVEQACWALGNIAGAGAEYRDLVLGNGVLPPLLAMGAHDQSIPIVRIAVWTLSNLCRSNSPRVDIHAADRTSSTCIDSVDLPQRRGGGSRRYLGTVVLERRRR
jgi:hypothetical protein